MGLQLSGSVQLEGNLLVTGSVNSVFENVLVTGTLVAQEIETQLVSSSIIYSSGSNKFGDLITDTQQFTGSLQVSGSSHNIIGATTFSNSLRSNSNIIVSDGGGTSVVLQGYIANTLRIAAAGSGNDGGSRGDLIAGALDVGSAATFGSSVTASGIISSGPERAFTWQRTTGTASDVYSLNADSATAYLYNNTTSNALMTWSESGSVGVGVVPSSWTGAGKNIMFGNGPASIGTQHNGDANFMHNVYENPVGTFRYAGSGVGALRYHLDANNNLHKWYYAASGTAGNTITFTQAMNLDASSRLGINYNNSAIHTYGSSAYSAQLTVKTSSSSALTLLNSTTGGDAQVAINFVNEFISDQYNYIARIIAEPEGSWTSTASTRDSRLSFHTTLNGVTSEAMRIASTANTQIYGSLTVDKGITVSSNAFGSFFGKFGAASTPVLELRDFDGDQTGTTLILRSSRSEIFYHLQAFNNSSTECFRIEANGNVKNTNSSYGSLSDVKIKENISDATPKLEDLLKVRIRNYNIIGQDIKQIGVIAQELEEVFPSMVDENADRDEAGNLVGTYTKGVKYSVFIPMLIKAIQEQQSQIEELKSRIETLENI